MQSVWISIRLLNGAVDLIETHCAYRVSLIVPLVSPHSRTRKNMIRNTMGVMGFGWVVQSSQPKNEPSRVWLMWNRNQRVGIIFKLIENVTDPRPTNYPTCSCPWISHSLDEPKREQTQIGWTETWTNKIYYSGRYASKSGTEKIGRNIEKYVTGPFWQWISCPRTCKRKESHANGARALCRLVIRQTATWRNLPVAAAASSS